MFLYIIYHQNFWKKIREASFPVAPPSHLPQECGLP